MEHSFDIKIAEEYMAEREIGGCKCIGLLSGGGMRKCTT